MSLADNEDGNLLAEEESEGNKSVESDGQPRQLDPMTELIDILKALVAISLAFAIATGGQSLNVILSGFLIALVTVGLGFVAHELCHKYTAQKLGHRAAFVASNQMLILALLMAFIGFVFAAPGAVVISREVDEESHGKIAAAGVAGSLSIAGVFLVLALFMPYTLVSSVAAYGVLLNAWIGLFNLIPAGPFDGKKIVKWNKLAYLVLALSAIGFLYLVFGGHLPEIGAIIS